MLGIPNFPPSTINRKPKDEIDDDVRLDDDWMPKDEELGVREEKEAHSRAVILESVGDIPDAETMCSFFQKKGNKQHGGDDVAAESPWEIKEEKSENQGSSTDHDPLTVSLFSFQAAVAREYIAVAKQASGPG
ncbi:hypothetical protein MTR67_049855 [Solanum verrucosum]|uniref:Uncharacterized protein n=1 Tax=Solanum verrucosum TaxID=315347 RepID=A0AAF0V0Y5_SOLVR|nr:hypothetical protein MTR67_049855 [Solanum verrucosum]